VTEAQLARGIKTLAYERIKKRLETEAPVQLFGHEFCAEIVEVGGGVSKFKAGDRVAARAKLPCGSLTWSPREAKTFWLCRFFVIASNQAFVKDQAVLCWTH